MDANKFSNYLIVIIIGLLLLGYSLFFFLWYKFKIRGFILACILVLVLDIIVLHYIQRVKVTDKHGVEKTIGDVLADFIIVTVIVSVVAVALAITSWAIGVPMSYKHERSQTIAWLIPVVNTGILIGAAYFNSRCPKK